MNVDRRWSGASMVRVRILLAGAVLAAAACTILGLGSHSHRMATNVAGNMTVAAFSPSQAKPGAAEYGTPAHALSMFSGLPLMFEPNQGQWNLDPADARAKFVSRGSGYSLFLGSGGAILSLTSRDSSKSAARKGAVRAEVLQMKVAGANPNASVEATDPLPGKSNYLIGNDPAKWRRGVPQFARVQYKNIYPGINLVFYGNQGTLEYDFQLAPGSDPARAELEFEGAKGLELKDGSLLVRGNDGSVQLKAPQVYQEIAGRREPVEGSFVLRGPKRAGFAIGAYDHSRELVIDPSLNFATYFGGAGNELSTYVAVDTSFNIYLTGTTTSSGLATPGVYQTSQKTGTSQNVYIAKITPPLGSNPAVLDFVTYLGGSDVDMPVGIGVDGADDPYVAGTTTSPDFPTTPTAYQTGPATGSTGASHVFVSELNGGPTPAAASALLYSSYLSGSGTDIASGMTIDAQGNVYVTGTTTSTNPQDYVIGVEWPVISLPYGQAFQNTPRAAPGVAQFFVTKVNTLGASASSIAYSTYFGGGTYETASPITTGGGIAVDSNGNVYFDGTTNFIYQGTNGSSTVDFPILNAYQPCLDSPPTTQIINPQTCTGISATSSSASDAFVAKLNPAGPAGSGQLVWSTYVGGTDTDTGTGVAIDASGNVYIIGTTNSPDVTTPNGTYGPFQPCLDGPNVAPGTACPTVSNPAPNDAFVARLTNPTSSTATTDMSLTYFSYLGGTANEAGLAIAADSANGALMTGWTNSPDFPVYPPNIAIQSNLRGTQNAFIARLNTIATAQTGQNQTASWASYYGGSGVDEGTSVVLDVNQNIYFAGDTTSPNLIVDEPLENYHAGSDAFLTEVGTASGLSITGCISPCTSQTQPYVAAGTQAQFVYTLTNIGPDLATGITVTDNLSPTYTNLPLTFSSASATSGVCSGGSAQTNVVCNIPQLQSGSTVTITITLIPTATSTGGSTSFNGGTVQVTGINNIVQAEISVGAKMSDFMLSVSPSNASVPEAGDTAPYQVLVTPQPVYNTAVSLACSSGVPTGATCNFTTTSVTLTGTSPGASTLNVVTTARPIITPTSSLRTLRRFYAVWLCVPGLALLGVGFGGRRRRRLFGILLLCTVFAMLLLLPACNHTVITPPVSGTPAGTYNITVTATAGNDSKSFPITLTVP